MTESTGKQYHAGADEYACLENPFKPQVRNGDAAGGIYEAALSRGKSLQERPYQAAGEASILRQHLKGRMTVWERIRSGTQPIPGVTGKLVVNAVLEALPQSRVVWMPKRDALIKFLASELRSGDLCLSMGCGDIATLPDEILMARGVREESVVQ